MIHVIEDFIDKGRATALLEFCQSVDFAEFVKEGFWESKVIPLRYETPEIKALKQEVVLEVREAIRQVCGQALYPDCDNFVRWSVGDWMGLHADGDYEDGAFDWRLFGAILYLSDDYDGGEIYFPNQDRVIKPKAGSLVFFPGKKPYEHGVKEITRGERYTMAMFWTDDQSENIMECLND